LEPSFALGDLHTLVEVPVAGIGTVCSFYPEGSTSAASSFGASATGGSVLSTFSLSGALPPHCIEVWNATGSSLVQLTASLLAPAEGVELERIVVLGGTEPITILGSSSATASVSDLVGASIWFKFAPRSTPPQGGQGCTPGYWKQSHHFDSWTSPYDPTDAFSSVFANAFPGKTLLQVLGQGGGGIKALGRQAVAALLSSASAGVSYDHEVAEVIAMFNAAYASGSATEIERLKDELDFLNNQGCPLN